MNILLVDDEQDILDGMILGIDFEALGIGTVFTASSSSEAKSMILSNHIDILVADIEMPGESGIELLEWIRSTDLEIVSLFCTSYSNFDYAKKAVELHCFDYYLKPIAYEELQKHLMAAAAQVRKNRYLKENLSSNQQAAKQIFWKDIMFSSTSVKELIHSSPDYSLEDAFLLCLVHISNSDPSLPLEDWKRYGFQNIANELLGSDELLLEAMWELRDRKWVLVFCRTEPPEVVLRSLKKMIRRAAGNLSIHINAYYLDDVDLLHVRESWDRLVKADTEDAGKAVDLVDASACVFFWPDLSQSQIVHWKELLATANFTGLLSDIKSKVKRDKISVEYLREMQRCILEIVIGELNNHNISSFALFDDIRYIQVHEKSLESSENFIFYTSFLLKWVENQITAETHGKSIVTRVKKYIKNHLGENLNRSSIAQQFFVHPDYLARLFKKETGQTLGEYLLEERIRKAKSLLIYSDMPMPEIASQVGYENYSYFSALFRKETGTSPRKYRKQG